MRDKSHKMEDINIIVIIRFAKLKKYNWDLSKLITQNPNMHSSIKNKRYFIFMKDFTTAILYSINNYF